MPLPDVLYTELLPSNVERHRLSTLRSLNDQRAWTPYRDPSLDDIFGRPIDTRWRPAVGLDYRRGEFRVGRRPWRPEEALVVPPQVAWVCVRRAVRREVLHAMAHAAGAGGGRHHLRHFIKRFGRHTGTSHIRC